MVGTFGAPVCNFLIVSLCLYFYLSIDVACQGKYGDSTVLVHIKAVRITLSPQHLLVEKNKPLEEFFLCSLFSKEY